VRLDATATWYAYEAVGSFIGRLVFTVTAVYFVTQVHMSPFELVLVGTVMELAVFSFEVPTGIVADVYSRRLSIVIGNVIMGAAIVLVAAVPAVWAILAGYAIWGLGWTFVSGAIDAWLADEIGTERLAPVVLRGAQIGRAAMIAGTIVSVALALVDLRLPILAGGLATIVLGAFFAAAMPETGFRPLPRGERSSLAHMAHTGRTGVRLVRARPILLAILGIAAFAGMWSESYDRLWQAHLIRDVGLPRICDLDPVVWFGILGVIAIVLTMAVARPVGRRLEAASRETMARTLFWLDVAIMGGALVFALAGQLWVAIAGSYVVLVARNVADPVFTTWLNRNIDESAVRATVISITNQADAVGQWTGGPALGTVGSVFSIRAALVAGAACLAPALALYGRAIRRAGRESELENLPEPA
jgi:DHA3 family tetracycline resistance protein-like MFS transporter